MQQWVIDGYTLLLLAGSLSDKFGAKRMFFFGTALFGAASLLSTFAWTMLVLIVGRCLMGVAAALILPASMALINEANPDPRRRAFALSVVGLGGALVTPALSGLVLVSVEQKQAGIASAVFNTFRQVGGAIGVAVFGVVATFTPSLDGSLRAVFVAAAVLLVAAFAYARLRWTER